MNQVRLNRIEISTIKELSKTIFHSESVYIFGSRADLNQKGGDIDIYLETEEKENIFNKKIEFLTKLDKIIGEQKIDLVINNFTKEKEIFKIAKENGIKL